MAKANKPEVEEVEVHRQCPICFRGANHGVGEAYHTRGSTRYYKCIKCGHTWKAIVTTTVVSVSHRQVDLETR